MADSGWTRFRLGELVEVKHGWAFKSECFDEHLTGEPIVVGVGNFRYTGGFRFDETANKEYRGSYPKEYELAPRDILLVMTCQTSGGEILGIPAKVPNDGRIYLHNQRLGKVVIRQGAPVDVDYLYWLFLWSEFNRELVTSASGTKILHTAPSRIEAFRFELPPLPEQRAIAHILGTLDDKIELNRRMNETLERQARALFKSWFVDFDPVRAKSERRDPGLPEHLAVLFPDAFEDSELGEIPKGWRCSRLHEVTSKIGSGATPRGGGSVYVADGAALIRSQNVYDSLFVWDGLARITDAAAIALEGVTVKYGDILLNITGASMLRTCIVDPEVLPARVSQHVCIIRPNPEMPSRYIHCHLLHRSTKSFLMGMDAGASRQAVTKGHIESVPLVIPPRAVLDAFASLVDPLFGATNNNESQSRSLAWIRDTLLPKLISGELRVKDAERFIGRCA